ncbi:hypothetical protein, partial [Nonomuraea rubra]|uniref:hypothetical protein n=1 Tax=Nonomuraea rubra TaxID=46180 RepID=UPI0031ECBDD8
MRKIAVGILSATIGGAMLVSGAGVASAATKADTRLVIRDISPNPVVVKKGSETTAYFDVGASSDVQKVELSVAPAENNFRTMRTKDVKDLEAGAAPSVFNENDYEGKWEGHRVAFDKDARRSPRTTPFLGRRRGRQAQHHDLRFSADPYKVRKGKSIYFSGRLLVNDDGWEGGARREGAHLLQGQLPQWLEVGRSDWTGRGGKFYARPSLRRIVPR